MTQQQPWFIDERAFAFASLVLTQGNDVAVRPFAGRDISIDLLAEVLKDGKSTARFFGAQVIGYLDLPSLARVDERVHSHLGRDPFEAGLPLCAFVIGVRIPEGIFRWVIEPIVDGGRARLQAHVLTQREAQASWQALDDGAVVRIVEQVNAYYDTLNGRTAPSVNARVSTLED